jgi:spore maturation protein CgeB
MLRNDAGEPDCLRAHFQPGVHYFEFEGDDFVEQAKTVLATDELRRDIGAAAAAAVRAKHTWAHRVDQILSDLAGL